mmetsp:Transcript_21059/g.45192  ORF Transcript_21059/g.45192 Transcript_21059/m.45192 type:complete len:204 (-) Transcript_21059:80-691(-)
MWRNPTRSTVKRELAYWDAHAMRTEITQSENPRTIGDTDHVDIFVRPIPNHRREETAVLAREVHASRTSKLVAKALAHDSNCRRIDERRELGDVVGKNTVVQCLVPIVELLKVEVGPHRVFAIGTYTLKRGTGLLFQRLHARGDEAAQVEPIAFRVVHCHALVPERVVQDVDALLLGLERLEVADPAAEMSLESPHALLPPRG